MTGVQTCALPISLKDMALGTGGVAFIVFYMLLLFVLIQSLAAVEKIGRASCRERV